MLRPVLIAAAGLLLLGVGTYGLSELRQARAAAAAANTERDQFERDSARERERRQELERELAAALGNQQRLNGLLAEQAARNELAARDRAEAARVALAPSSEQAVAVMRKLQRCLSEDGHGNLRVLRITRIGDRALEGVELLEQDRRELRTTLYLAGRMTLTLDRTHATVALRCFDGAAVTGSERTDFPPEGLAVVLGDVLGEMWEAELPAVLCTEGTYPVPAPREPRRVQPSELAIWRERLDILLAASAQGRTLRVSRLGGVTEQGFADVVLLFYSGRLLTGGTEAARLRVLVDDATDSVELELHDGIVFHSGGSTAIPATGYRIALPGLPASVARERMLGFVHGATR